MDPGFQQVIEEHLGVFLFALFFSVLSCFIAWYRSFFTYPPFESKEVGVDFNHLLWGFFIYFATSLILPFLILKALHLFPADVRSQMNLALDQTNGWLNITTVVVLFILMMFFLAKMQKNIRESVLGVNSSGPLQIKIKHFAIGALTWVVSFPLVVAISQLASIFLIFFHLESKEQLAVLFLKSTMGHPVLLTFTIFLIVLLVPIIEEILFRGLLLNWLTTYFKRTTAIFLHAIAFAGFHFSLSQGFGNIEIISSLFVLSCFLGFVYLKQKSIYASWGLHATFNGINIILMAVSK